ncbi:hypothetical protein LSH36_533g01060, partial [Paralvinella palmiformis]
IQSVFPLAHRLNPCKMEKDGEIEYIQKRMTALNLHKDIGTARKLMKRLKRFHIKEISCQHVKLTHLYEYIYLSFIYV